MVAHTDPERLPAESGAQWRLGLIADHETSLDVWPGTDRERGGLPVAAADGVAALINGPVRTGQVIGVVSHAVIVVVDAAPDEPEPSLRAAAVRVASPRVVSLLDRAATGVPNGVRMPTSTGFAQVAIDAPVVLGGGEIRVGDLSARVVRTWDSRVPPTRPDARSLAEIDDAAQSSAPGVPPAAVHRLAAALRSEPGQPGPLTTDAGSALLGLGAGLTPGGDDILAGMLIGWHAAGRSELARTWGSHLIESAAESTTALSADLLRLAAGGHACLEILAVLRASAAESPPNGSGPSTRLRPALRRLLSVGHTSGVDLTTGLALGLRYAMTTTDPATGQPSR